jgi:Arc/MetJ-type ribon-helix-helix transcriptional regulator
MTKNDGRDKVTLKIPRPLYNKISEVIEGSGYNSVTDFVVYVLRDLMGSRQAPSDDQDTKPEMQSVRQHLKALGYLE